jgi:hypothetical protein
VTADPTQQTLGEPLLNAGIFLFFVLVTVVIVIRASRTTTTTADYNAAGRSFTGPSRSIRAPTTPRPCERLSSASPWCTGALGG